MEEYLTRRSLLVAVIYAVCFLFGFEALRALPIDPAIKFLFYITILPTSLLWAAHLALPRKKQ